MPNTERDVVAMPSLRSDGTPDQTSDYRVLTPEGAHADAGEFTEFREVTQETVLPPEDSPAAAVVAEGQQGATPEESTPVPGSEEATVAALEGTVEASQAVPESEPAPPTAEQQAVAPDASGQRDGDAGGTATEGGTPTDAGPADTASEEPAPRRTRKAAE